MNPKPVIEALCSATERSGCCILWRICLRRVGFKWTLEHI
jgi:hypothetical protein